MEETRSLAPVILFNGFNVEHITKDQFEFMVDLIHETIVDETGTKTHLNMVDKLIEVSRTEYED